MITYIILFIGFLVAMKFVLPKLNALSGFGPGGAQEKYKEANDAVWQKVAQELGLEFTSIAKPTDPKVWQGGGVLLKGHYKGKEIEMRFVHETRQWAEGLKNGYEYFIDHKVRVFGAAKGSWQIVPKDVAPQGVPTGNQAFDAVLSALGDTKLIPVTVLEGCAKYGWMNLALKDGVLVFTDDYAQYYQRKNGSMSVISMQHVIWGTSANQINVEMTRVTALLDLLIVAANGG